MAKIVDEFPSGNTRTPQYPYEDWFDGQIWALEKGEDFKTSVEGLRSSVHNAAKRMNIRVQTKIRGEVLFVQSLPEAEEPEDGAE